MKVYTLPKGLEAPEPDYSNYDHAKEAAAEAAHQAKVKDWLLKNGYPGPNTGRIYREPVADGHAIYMFADNGAKSALIHLPYGDAWQSRTASGLSRTAVLKLIASTEQMDSFFDRANKEKEDFWASRKVGEVLHYHNSFGQFLRGVVVEVNGEKQFKPTAMVGKWSAHDLTRRLPDGSIRGSYHTRQIENGDSWQPHDGCVYESPSYVDDYKRYGDPRAMPEIDLTLPEMSNDEVQRADREKLIQQVVTMASSDSRDYRVDDSEQVLKNMYAALKGHFKD